MYIEPCSFSFSFRQNTAGCWLLQQGDLTFCSIAHCSPRDFLQPISTLFGQETAERIQFFSRLKLSRFSTLWRQQHRYWRCTLSSLPGMLSGKAIALSSIEEVRQFFLPLNEDNRLPRPRSTYSLLLGWRDRLPFVESVYGDFPPEAAMAVGMPFSKLPAVEWMLLSGAMLQHCLATSEGLCLLELSVAGEALQPFLVTVLPIGHRVPRVLLGLLPLSTEHFSELLQTCTARPSPCAGGETSPDSIPLAPLTHREQTVAALLCGPDTLASIAAQCGVTIGTIKKISARIYEKYRVHSRIALVRQLSDADKTH